MSDDDSGPSEVRIRRAPRLGAFLFLGAVVGTVATLVLTSLYPADPAVGFAASFGYFLIFGLPAGAALGAVTGLVVDAVASRRATMVRVEREEFAADDAQDAPTS